MRPQLSVSQLALLAAASLLAVTHSAHADPLLVDGGFESAPIAIGSPFAYLTGTQLTGWTTFAPLSGTILFNTAYMPVAEGNHAVQIERPGDSISQTFATTVGASYRVSFEMSAYTAYGGPGLGASPCPCTSLTGVSAGSVDAIFEGSSSGYSYQSFDFQAASAFTTLTFSNPSIPATLGNFPHLDNVSVVLLANERFANVTPVPEPETYALLLAGLALVGAVRRRAKVASR